MSESRSWRSWTPDESKVSMSSLRRATRGNRAWTPSPEGSWGPDFEASKAVALALFQHWSWPPHRPPK